VGLFNWLFGLAAKKVADKEYGPGQTAYAPEKPVYNDECVVDNPPLPKPPDAAP
jgi:hypothetical protein